MGKTLIAVAGCHQYKDRADAQRQTWVKDVGTAADVRFFSGTPHPDGPIPDDEVWLDCPDCYKARKQKVLAIVRWAVDCGYDHLWKVDDDVYLRPERLFDLEPYDYCGAIPEGWGVFSGAIYGLSRASMEKLLTPDTRADQLHEDIWIWNRLSEYHIPGVNLGGVDGVGGRIHATQGKGRSFRVLQEPPTPDNDVIASWEYAPAQMQEIHAAFTPGHD
jgi:hypothetical protein